MHGVGIAVGIAVRQTIFIEKYLIEKFEKLENMRDDSQNTPTAPMISPVRPPVPEDAKTVDPPRQRAFLGPEESQRSEGSQRPASEPLRHGVVRG